MSTSRAEMRRMVERERSVKRRKLATLVTTGAVVTTALSSTILGVKDSEKDGEKVQAKNGDFAENYINTVSSHAQNVASSNGLYASVMIAQSILESDWGRSTLTTTANNYFGIKGNYNGQSVKMATMEDDGKGNLYQIMDNFRKYPSPTESFQDNANLLRNNIFYRGAWMENTSSYQDATQWLTGRYATDTTYNSKLNNLIETYNLTRFDSNGGGTVSKKGGSGETVKTPISNSVNYGNNSVKTDNNYVEDKDTTIDNSSSEYTVKSGDNLYRISLKHGVNLDELKKLNGLDSDVIYVGQKIKLPREEGATKQNDVTKEDSLNEETSSKDSSTEAVSDNVGLEDAENNAPKYDSNAQYHTVSKGDNLYRLGLKYGTTADELVKLNNLKDYTIYVGQNLKVKEGRVNVYDTPNEDIDYTDTETHTVQKGDNLYRLAKKYGTTEYNIRFWNNIEGNNIYVGQKLIVKAKNTVNPEEYGTIDSKHYRVKTGDNLYRIAVNNNITLGKLLDLNNMTGSSKIVEGDILKISE